jgi:pyruvate-formate lyase
MTYIVIYDETSVYFTGKTSDAMIIPYQGDKEAEFETEEEMLEFINNLNLDED